MRFTTGVFVLGLTLNQIQTLAQVIVTQTVSIDTGACAAASRTGGPGGSGVGDSNGGPSGGPIPPYVPLLLHISMEADDCAFSSPGVPTTVDISYGVFYFAGFYALPTTGNLLDGASTSSPTASLESCGSFCGRSSYFALEQGEWNFECSNLILMLFTPLPQSPRTQAMTTDHSASFSIPSKNWV